MATLEDIDRKLDLLLSVLRPAPPSPLTVGQQAIQLARQGKIEESKELLRAHSKQQSRRKAA